MSLPTLLFTAALSAALVTPAFPQFDLGGARSCRGSGDGAVTMSFDVSPTATAPVVGAPYSGVRSDQSVQTLPDGTHLTSHGRREIATWRDSAGRVRIEIRAPQDESRPASACETGLAEIQDPVARYIYLLDSVGQVAYRLQLTVPPPAAVRTAAPKPAPAQAQTSPEKPTFAREPLGEKTMFGITVTGIRTTVTYPVNSRNIGNDRPVTDIVEDWVSPEIRETVFSQRTNYNGTVSTTTLRDLSVAEPDPSLFQIPPGYKVIDESGQFTITIPARN